MKRDVVVKDIEIIDGKDKRVVRTYNLPHDKARYMSMNFRRDAADIIETIGGKSKIKGDHFIYCGEIYGPRGGFKELHHFIKGNDMSDEDFFKFINDYNYVGAFHK